MENIVFITGEVNFTITLDPGSWLFDDRKVNLGTYFDTPAKNVNEIDETEEASKRWDKTIKEGNALPGSNNNKVSKQEILTGDYGICLGHFLKNAEPKTEATEVIFETTDNKEYHVPLAEACEGILAFSSNGKPLSEGPLHFYYKDGRNKNTPFTNIYKIAVK